jgi:electron transport complex protein RnfG
MSASPHGPSAPAPAPAPTPTRDLVLTLGLVAAVCGLIIVAAYQVTYEAVANNRRIALERSVFKVIPAATSLVEYHALPAGGVAPASAGELPAGAIRFFAAYDAAGRLAGVAAEGSAKGYADSVRVLFAYQPACQCITGIGVVSMRETPGIGDKIVTDKAFLANFQALDARLNAGLTALAHEIRTVKHGTKANAWQVDAISGATITSRAVGKAVNDSAQALLPRLVPNLEKVRSKP